MLARLYRLKELHLENNKLSGKSPKEGTSESHDAVIRAVYCLVRSVKLARMIAAKGAGMTLL